ncbi:MAG: fructosamine kinase family protein [Burkholderiales bacterium]|nr:fructosamine kinase family protein [Phycisphaerae bacterium]
MVQSAAVLAGGIQSHVQRLVTDAGESIILKQHAHAPADWYSLEAEGLRLLDRPNCPRVPKVLAVGEAFLLLEDVAHRDLQPAAASNVFWEAFGRSLAHLHRHTASLHGFDHDNYLGLMPQHNGQMADGREFFIERRVLRYLREPLAEQTLTLEDRRGVERLCERIRRDVPDQPASLCHGDLWTGNMLVGPAGNPAYIDPAVHYGLAEAELSLTRQFSGVPDSFYDAYIEVNPLETGWESRLPLYELKEMLGLIAQFGDEHEMVSPLRQLIRRFS